MVVIGAPGQRCLLLDSWADSSEQERRKQSCAKVTHRAWTGRRVGVTGVTGGLTAAVRLITGGNKQQEYRVFYACPQTTVEHRWQRPNELALTLTLRRDPKWRLTPDSVVRGEDSLNLQESGMISTCTCLLSAHLRTVWGFEDIVCHPNVQN